MEKYKTNRHYIYLSGFYKYSQIEFGRISSKVLGNIFDPCFFKFPYNKAKDLMTNYLPNYFYSNFRNIIFPELELTSFLFSENKSDYPPKEQILDKIRSLKLIKLTRVKPLEAAPAVILKQSTIPFNIDFIDYYFFPDRSGIFSIKLEIGDEHPEISHMSDFLNCIRNLDGQLKLNDGRITSIRDFINQEVLPTVNNFKIFEPLSASDFNNKLKIFNVTEFSKPIKDPVKQTDILYDIGTVSPIRNTVSDSFFSPSQKYIDEVMEKNGLFVFNNWASLNLLDTNTILSFESQKGYGIFETSESYYFPIYIYNLYHKLCLLDFSSRFAETGKANNNTRKLRDKFIRFRNAYDIPKLSYNFLPEKINEKMRIALDIDDEIRRMDERIEKIHSFIQERQDKKTNMILTILSILSVSTLFINFFDWFQNFFNIPQRFHTLTNIGVTGILILIIFILLFLFNRTE